MLQAHGRHSQTATAPSMPITALDTGTRQGEMLALRFGDIESARIDSEIRETPTTPRPAVVGPDTAFRRERTLFGTGFDADGVKRC